MTAVDGSLSVVNRLLCVGTAIAWFFYPFGGIEEISYKIRILSPVMLVVLLAVSWLEAESGNRMRLWAMLRTRAVEITWCLIWLVVVAANELLNRGSGGPATHLIQTLYGIMWYSVGMLATLKVGGNLRFVLMFLVIAGVACVVGLPAMWDNPMLARLASNGKTVEAFGDEASAKAVGIFQAYSAFSIIVAAWIGVAWHQRGVWRIAANALLVPIAASLLVTTSAAQMTLLLVSVSAILIWYILRRFRKYRLAICGTGIIAVTAILSVLTMGDWSEYEQKPQLDDARSGVGGALTFAYHKAGHLALGMVTGGFYESDDSGRRELFEISWATFKEWPIFGYGPDTRLVGGGTLHQGGHAWIIDFLAQYGILGFSPFLIFLLLVIWRFLVWCRADPGNSFAFGCLVSLILFTLYGLKNGLLMHEYATPMLFAFMGIGHSTAVGLDGGMEAWRQDRWRRVPSRQEWRTI